MLLPPLPKILQCMRLSPTSLGTRSKSFLTHSSLYKLPHSSLSSKHQMQFYCFISGLSTGYSPLAQKILLALLILLIPSASLDLKNCITYQVNSIHPSTPQQSNLSLQYVLTMPRPNTMIRFIKLVHCKYWPLPALHLEILRVRLNTTVPSSAYTFLHFSRESQFLPNLSSLSISFLKGLEYFSTYLFPLTD